MELAETLGGFVAQIAAGGLQRLELRALGGFADLPLRPLAMAATRGLLRPALGEGVSHVNALGRAEERGIAIDEARSRATGPWAALLRLTLQTEEESVTVAGTLFGEGQPRLVEIDGVSIEYRPRGHLLFFRNRDVPGVVGRIGTILGRASVNIAGIQLGRREGGTDAVSIIDVDGEVPAAALAEIRRIEEIVLVRAVKV
jgi:D-3-phosphoglycerate dehydrogenase